MKIYEVGGLDEGSEYFPTEREAIVRARDYDLDDGYVTEHEIGRLTKEVACRLASGRGFSKARREIDWRS